MSRWGRFLYNVFGYKNKEFYERLCELQSCDIKNLNCQWIKTLEENKALKHQIDAQQSTFQKKFNMLKSNKK